MTDVSILLTDRLCRRTGDLEITAEALETAGHRTQAVDTRLP